MTRTLIVGAGSIGRRHAEVIADLGVEVAVVSRRQLALPYPSFSNIATALSRFQPGYVVLARETVQHRPDLLELHEQGFAGKVLVEKPLAEKPLDLPGLPFERVAVGYNLRFHPLLARIRDELQATGPALTASVYVGQHLSTWRPGSDYRTGYSADPDRGGGVLRDLSHELDYLQWLLGPWRSVCATGGRSGALDVRSDDHWSLLLTSSVCPAIGLQLNYLDHIGQRIIIITTATSTLHADLVRNTLQINDHTEHIDIERNHTYRRQHTAMLEELDADLLCSLEDGQRTVELIDAVERSATARTWIEAA